MGLLEEILDRIRGGMPPDMFSGLPSDQAQYGQPTAALPADAAPSSLDTASWPFGPNGAPQRRPRPSPLDTAQWPFGPNGAPSQVGMVAAGAGGPAMATDISSRARSPAPPAALAPPSAPPDSAAPVEQSMFGRLGGGIMSGLSDNSNALLAMGAGFAGAPNIGQAISRASAAMIPAHAADVKQRLTLQAQTYGTRALVEAGVPIQQAIAAQGDPDLKKALIQNYITDRKGELKEIGVDRYGNKIMGVFDPYTKQITPVKTGLESNNATVNADNDVTGPDYLAKLKESDPAYARQVEQVINGDAAMPTGRQAMTPLGRRLRQDVLTVEPGASDSDFATRQATQKSYTSGNDAKVTKSINTTLHHAETLERAINELDNFSTLPGVLNPARSLIKGQYDPKYQKAKGDYETAVANFAKELDFAVSGGRPTVSGTRHQMEGFNLNAPKVEQMAKLQQGVDLLKGRLESHAEGYNKGRRTARDAFDFIDPVNRKFYERVLSEGGATIGGRPAAAAPAPLGVGKSVVINGVTIKRLD